jgi:hypothetical protein
MPDEVTVGMARPPDAGSRSCPSHDHSGKTYVDFPDVEGLIGMGLGAEKSGVDRLGGIEVADWVDNGL